MIEDRTFHLPPISRMPRSIAQGRWQAGSITTTLIALKGSLTVAGIGNSNLVYEQSAVTVGPGRFGPGDRLSVDGSALPKESGFRRN